MSSPSPCRCGRAAPKAPRSSRPSRRSWSSPRSATAARPARTGVTGEIVYFDSVDALRAAPDSAVAGKIVFIDHHMMPAQDGSGYGQFGAPRRQGPTIASQKGALGDRHPLDRHRPSPQSAHRRPIFHRRRDADPGRRADAFPTPSSWSASSSAASRSSMHLTLVSQKTRRRPFGQRHRRSAGTRSQAPRSCSSAAISTAGTRAPARSTMAPASRSPPRRPSTSWTPAGRCSTIRVVWFGAEEPGGFGGAAYAKAHGMRPLRHRRRKRFRRRPRVALQLAAHEERSGGLRAARRRARSARHHQERQGRSRRHRRRTDDHRPARRGSRSTRTAPAISTITTRPTTRSTRSIPPSFARTSPRGRRCSPCCRAGLSRSRNGAKRR